jgi:enhancing lycopene biosynthesis protein 2
MEERCDEKIGVVLSGCGVYDGSEIHEAVITLLAIARNGAQAVCFAPDKPQRDVINHLTGEAQTESAMCWWKRRVSPAATSSRWRRRVRRRWTR